MNTIPDIVTIAQMIDSAFGDSEKNVVHHKLIQAVLIILAKQLRLLDRRVKIELFNNPDFYSSGSSLSVTEVKIQANIKKKRRTTKPTLPVKGKGAKGTGPGQGPPRRAGETETEQEPSGGITRATAETIDEYAKGHISITAIKTRSLPSDPKHGNVYTSRVAMPALDEPESPQDRSTAGRITFLGKKHSSSTDKSSTSTSEQTTTDKTSSDKTTTESPTDKTTTSTDKTTTESSTEKSAMETTDKSSRTKASTTKTTSDKQTSRKHRFSEFEMAREQELRIVHQRADSREERDKTPTPMASMDSVEVQYEKLLVVERVPSDEAKARIARLQGETQKSVPRLSIVTQEEFLKLVAIVQKLQAKFDPIGSAEFPEKLQLMQDLRKGASLTDAMAALQLSARLEAAEKALGRMTSLVTELASKYSDIDLTQLTGPFEPETEVLYHGAPSQTAPPSSKTPAFKEPLKAKKSQSKKLMSKELLEEITPAATTSAPSEKAEEPAAAPVEEEKDNANWITMEDLENSLQEIYDNVMSSITGVINKSKASSETALKVANRLEGKLDASLDLGDRMADLETLVADYAEKINILDTGLSSQMTNYQELLTQMQHDLEAGLENMSEALASSGGDTTAMAELNSHFTNLQLDFETTNSRQNELNDIQNALRSELEELRKQIEVLRGTKSDRDEVADALRDKVGLGTLNGLTSLEQFDAVRGDLEQRICAAYDKFNNQELVWQKAIDEIFRELGEKADWTQVVFLREDVKNNIQKLKNRIQAMLDIVGEPQAAAVSRRLHRDTNCLSCSTPAHMGLEEDTIPNLPAMPGTRPPTLGAESPEKHKEQGFGLCYPNLPIPHLREPRAHVCQRYCGGSHTKISTPVPRVPPGMLINPALKQGSGDAKTDEKGVKKPCIPCNVKPKVTKDLPTTEHVVKEDIESLKSAPADGGHVPSLKSEGKGDSIGETPPIPREED